MIRWPKIINIYSIRCTFSILTVSPVNYPLLRLTWNSLQEHVVYSPWFFWRHELLFHFCIGGHRFSPRVGVIKNLKRFYVLFGNKLLIIWSYLLWCFSLFTCFCSFLIKEQRWPILVVVIINSSILLGKSSKKRRSKYLYNKEQSNAEIRNEKTFHIFSFLRFGFGRIEGIGIEMEDWNVRFSEDNSALHLSYLATPWKMLQYRFLEYPCFILFQFDYWWKYWYCSFNWRNCFLRKQLHIREWEENNGRF